MTGDLLGSVSSRRRAMREAGFWIAASLWDGHTRNFLPVDFEKLT